MPPKRSAVSPSIAKKTRKSLTLKVKLDIIHRHERDSIKKAGETVSSLQAKEPPELVTRQ
ncbi:hypothetical protein E2C01_076679 [Portunus trituberculatus]|uniref:Uncharacterized protein n=1 Tax=Portunus trituberculatus TaxID=210409 RepID=A0A5B7IJK0_PORTR|nr:hypothetical protein [Portunus trituberculatus]